MKRQYSITGDLNLYYSRIGINQHNALEKIDEGFKAQKNTHTLLGILGLYSFTTEENSLRNTIYSDDLYAKITQLKNISYCYLNSFTQQNLPKTLKIIEDLEKHSKASQLLLQIINKHSSVLSILNILVRVHTLDYLKNNIHIYSNDFMGNEIQILQNILVQPRNEVLNVIADSLTLQLQFKIDNKNLEIYGRYCQNYIPIKQKKIDSQIFFVFNIQKTEKIEEMVALKHKRKISQAQPKSPKIAQRFLTGTNKEIPISEKCRQKNILESPYFMRRNFDQKFNCCLVCNKVVNQCRCSKQPNKSKQKFNNQCTGNNRKYLWKDRCYQANLHS